MAAQFDLSEQEVHRQVRRMSSTAPGDRARDRRSLRVRREEQQRLEDELKSMSRSMHLPAAPVADDSPSAGGAAAAASFGDEAFSAPAASAAPT